jgi:hypothetical protein
MRLLRHAQSQLRSGRWPASYVFYTEGDQVLHASEGILKMAGAIAGNPRAYVSPNRLEEVYEGYGRDRGPNVDFDGRTFAVYNNCA